MISTCCSAVNLTSWIPRPVHVAVTAHVNSAVLHPAITECIVCTESDINVPSDRENSCTAEDQNMEKNQSAFSLWAFDFMPFEYYIKNMNIFSW